MADPLGIIGLTGTVEQLVRLTNHLIHSYKALQENTPAAKSLLETYEELQSMLEAVSVESFEGAKESHIDAVKHELDTMKRIFTDAQNEVQVQSDKSEKWASRYVSALKDKAGIEKLTADASKIRECMFKLSCDENLNWRLNKLSTSDRDEFSATIWAEKNPTSVYIDLNAKDEDGRASTCESKLKEAVLEEGGEPHVGAVAVGQGGVGKTCTLRAIANDVDVGKRFTGGIYLLSLGEDASIGTIIQQLCVAVKASGGRKLARQLETEDDLASVVAGVHDWFKEGAVLFIFDDVWIRNGIDGRVLQTLSRLLGNVCGERCRKSRILYSTRDEGLCRFGRTITFEPRAREGVRSVEILLHVAREDWKVREDRECGKHIGAILEKCGGLPLALNVAGSAVRVMKERWKGDAKGAWKKYSEMMSESDEFERRDPGDGYCSLDTMFCSSLKILEDGKEEEEKFGMSFKEMHRALCVLKRQDWLPLCMLQHLWGTTNEVTAERVVAQFKRVGVAELQYRSGGGGIRLHDLTHDFTVREAKKHDEVEKWHRKLLKKYRVDDGCMADTMATCDDEGEKRYLCENVYRVCRKARLYEDVYRLVRSALWVTVVLEQRAIFQFEQGVKELTDGVTSSSEGWGGGEGWLDEESKFGLRMIAKAVRLSVSYLDGSVRNVFFQLYGRLMGVCDKSCLVGRFLKDLEKCAPKPWMRPITRCLVGVDDTTLEQVKVGFRVNKVQFTSDGVVGCGRGIGAMEVWFFKQNRSMGVAVMKLADDNVSLAALTRESEAPSRARKGQMSREEEIRGGYNRKERTARWLLQQLRAAVNCYGRCCQRDEEQQDEEEQDEDDHELRVSCSDAYEDLVAVGFSDGTIQVRRLSTNKIECAIKEQTEGVSCICFSTDGKWMVSGSRDGTVRVWDVGTGAPVCDALEGHTDSVRSVAISGDGERVASGSDDETVRVWDVATGASVCDALEGHMDWVTSVAISGDGERVVSGSRDRTVRVWDVSKGAPVCDALEGQTGSVSSVAISGDGKRVVSGSLDETVRVWDVGTGVPVCNALEGHTDWVTSVAVSGDGQRVVSGSWDKTMRVWDVGTGVPVCDALEGHMGSVTSVAVSGDGERVVSGSRDRTIRVWNVSTGALVCEALEGHTNWVTSVAISGDGKWVVSGSRDWTVRVWDAATGDCSLVTERNKWEETVAQYCGSKAEGGNATASEEEERYYSDGNSVVRQSGNGSAEILGQFESDVESIAVDSMHGVVVAGFKSGVVAILKVINE